MHSVVYPWWVEQGLFLQWLTVGIIVAGLYGIIYVLSTILAIIVIAYQEGPWWLKIILFVPAVLSAMFMVWGVATTVKRVHKWLDD